MTNDVIDYINKRYTELTGHCREDAIGTQSWANLYHPDDIQMAWDHFHRAAESGDDLGRLERYIEAACERVPILALILLAGIALNGAWSWWRRSYSNDLSKEPR